MAVEQKVPGVKKAAPKVDVPAGVQQDEQENSVREEAETGRKRHPGPWVKLHADKKENAALVIRHGKAGNLVGHDPKTGEVILKDSKFVLPKEEPQPMDGGIK